MNSPIARQQSKQRSAVQRVRVAAREGRNNTSARTRRQAISSLVRCLETHPSQKEWTEAIDSVLLGRWPNIMTMPFAKQDSALAEFCAIVEEARAIVRAKQLLLNPLALQPVRDAMPEQSNHHQAAVNSLLELTMAARWPDTPVAVPFDQVPALFRAAVEAAGSQNPYPAETDLIEYALMLIDRNGGDATIRTPEQEQFYADLLLSLDANEQVRITYSPSNVTVH